MKDNKLDAAEMHFLSTESIQIPNVNLMLSKWRMEILQDRYKEELKWIESLPKDLLYFELIYNK